MWDPSLWCQLRSEVRLLGVMMGRSQMRGARDGWELWRNIRRQCGGRGEGVECMAWPWTVQDLSQVEVCEQP